MSNELVNFNKEEENDLIKGLNSIIGKELKYKGLCQELNLKIKTGNAKKAQLEDLQMFCQLDKLTSPTRFIVNEVYNKSILGLGVLNKNNKYQMLFEASIYQAFLNNGNNDLWLSNMEMLKLFQEVNDNFSYACNQNLMKRIGPEFIYISQMSQTVYRILRQWTKRRIEFMAKREIILLGMGYRVYTKHYSEHGEYFTYKNVVKGSEEEKMCTAIRNQAIEEVMPSKWENEWVPEWQWNKFEKRVSELTEKKFNGEYCDVKLVNVISPPSLDWLKDKLTKIYKDIEDLTGINKEACRKILTTTQLDNYTGEEKKNFIKINMSKNPEISFKSKLREDKKT